MKDMAVLPALVVWVTADLFLPSQSSDLLPAGRLVKEPTVVVKFDISDRAVRRNPLKDVRNPPNSSPASSTVTSSPGDTTVLSTW